jgi:hypothetical protein
VSVIAMPLDKNKSERAQSAVEYLRDEARCDMPDIRQKPFKGIWLSRAVTPARPRAKSRRILSSGKSQMSRNTARHLKDVLGDLSRQS